MINEEVELQSLRMAECRKNQLLDITIRYNDKEYVAECDRGCDIFHAGIFVREMLMHGTTISDLEQWVEERKPKLNNDAYSFLKSAILEGGQEYKATPYPKW